MTKHPDLFAALAAPFDASEVKIRSQSNRQFHYVTARTVMNRLDTVLGPEAWWDAYSGLSDNSVECRLTIRLPDGTTLTKCDAGGAAGMADEGDDDKSTYSDAFKRAAVKFGVARYLYRDGVPTFAQERAPEPAATAQDAPRATPATNGRANGHAKPRDVWGDGKPARANGTATATRPADGKAPRTGKALFGWVKEREEKLNVRLLAYLNRWGQGRGFPGRMVDWDADQVALAHAEALRKLAAIDSQEGPDE